MRERPLAWRVEDCCHNAWPALRQAMVGDWMLRFAGGVSRRANSANPLRAQLQDIDAAVAATERLYRAQGLPALFRIPAIVDPAMDARLDRLGYTAEGETVTLCGDLASIAARPDAEVETLERPSTDWLAAMARLQGHTPERALTYRRIVEAIAIPALFCGLRQNGQYVALAFGAVHDGLLCFESVITEVAQRGRGHGRRVLGAILAWGARGGAETACLQVQADNAPALKLYRGLGLTTELYRYHYRRAPPRRQGPRAS
ncbi:MAG: GNAT family N-acetyltransferase [Alphaproteobacteria bacterium]|nr:GNAT family N-acetyltransferase [Alphaproteobacteria bacterium]